MQQICRFRLWAIFYFRPLYQSTDELCVHSFKVKGHCTGQYMYSRGKNQDWSACLLCLYVVGGVSPGVCVLEHISCCHENYINLLYSVKSEIGLRRPLVLNAHA